MSQSVEHEHPNSMEFLRKDCENVNIFFSKKNVKVMTNKEFFEFVVNAEMDDKQAEQHLEKMKEILKTRPSMTNEEIVADQVFKNSYMPRNLKEVIDHEQDFEMITKTNSTPLYYDRMVKEEEAASEITEEDSEKKKGKGEKMKAKKTKKRETEKKEEKEDKLVKEEEEEGKEEEEDSEENSEGEEDEEKKSIVPPKRERSQYSKDEIRKLRKENKKMVKEENKEKRKTKMKKQVKKKLEKKSKATK